MNLIDSIIADASERSVPIEGALLKVKVLAAKLQNAMLGTWAKSEIEGYPPGTELPAYRKVRGRLRAHFSGWDRGHFRRQTMSVPTHVLPPQLADEVEEVHLRQSIDSIERLGSGSGSPCPHIELPSELAALIHNKVLIGAEVNSVFVELAPSQMQQVVSSVRSALLDLVLALGADPTIAGLDPTKPIDPKSSEAAAHVIGVHITGDRSTVAIAGHGSTQTVVGSADSSAAFDACLQSLGVTAEQLTELKRALESDGRDAGKKAGVGSRVLGWFGGLGKTIAAEAAAQVVTAVMKRYAGA